MVNITFKTESGATYFLEDVKEVGAGEYTAKFSRSTGEKPVVDWRSGSTVDLEASLISFWHTPVEGYSFSYFHPIHKGCKSTKIIEVVVEENNVYFEDDEVFFVFSSMDGGWEVRFYSPDGQSCTLESFSADQQQEANDYADECQRLFDLWVDRVKNGT